MAAYSFPGIANSNSGFLQTAITPKVSVFLPKEHGSWSLAFEPLALGLLVAPSSPGGALALAIIAAFFVRRPFKAILKSTPLPHREVRPAAAILTVCAGVGLAEAGILGGFHALGPLLVAAPFAGLFLYFEAQGESRAAAAELAGCTAFALLPTAFATLAGWPTSGAFALSVISLLRSLPTVLTIRTYLRLRKYGTGSRFAPLLAALLGFGAIALLAVLHQVPVLVLGAGVVLLFRTAWYVSAMAPQWTAKRIGITEAALGVICLAFITYAYHH